MEPVRLQPDDLMRVLPPGGLTLLSSCSTESLLLHEAVTAAGDGLGAMCFTGIFVPGLNRRTWLAGRECRSLSFFMTPELKAAGDRVAFLPLCYDDIRRLLHQCAINAALFMVAPPDANGWCSFGPAVDFLAELWPRIPVRIAHVNPLMPRTPGHRGIPFRELTAVLEGGQPPLGMKDDGGDMVAAAIARHIAPHVPDGATLQTGLGRIPGAVLRALTGHRGLRFHTGLIGDAVLDLIDASALAPGPAVTAGVAIGTQRLYDRVAEPCFDFQPVAVTHDPRILGSIDRLVTINSAIEIDLFGQAYAELTPRGLMSGPGGATDFARGCRIGNGLRIVALPSSADGGRISRIVSPGAAAGPVSLSRTEIDLVVTEHGVADLRGKGYADRVTALIAVAEPVHCETLERAWADYAHRL